MRYQLLVAMAVVTMFAYGCDNPQTNSAGDGGSSSTAHDHDHDHDHDAHDHAEHDHPEHGPNHGHIFKIEAEGIQGEWKQYKDNNVIKMYLLDMEKKPVALKVDSFKVTPLAGNDSTPFELAADDTDFSGETSAFSLEDADLRRAIPLGVTIEIVAGDKTLKGKIDAHEPMDH